ncbi:glycosyltransferase family 2 protein [Celeribacter sp. ULVN23_4]
MVKNNLPLIVFCICTYKRPKMIVSCLSAAGQLEMPEDMRAVIVVIDNEASEQTREIISLTSESSRLPIEYRAESKRGLCHARNTALETAIELKADWVAFVDDDQTVPANWLIEMMSAQNTTHADVVQTAIEYRRPDGSLIKSAQKRWQYNLPQAFSYGVLFSAKLIRPDGQNLRFDERFTLSGGEDRLFFSQAHAAGAQIVATPKAVITEHVMNEKASLKATFLRRFNAYRVATLQDRERFGLPATSIKVFKFALVALYKALASALLGVLIYPFTRPYAEKKFRKAAIAVGESTGAARGLYGKQLPSPYSTTTGE